MVSFEWIPRERNEDADALAFQSSFGEKEAKEGLVQILKMGQERRGKDRMMK